GSQSVSTPPPIGGGQSPKHRTTRAVVPWRILGLLARWNKAHLQPHLQRAIAKLDPLGRSSSRQGGSSRRRARSSPLSCALCAFWFHPGQSWPGGSTWLDAECRLGQASGC